jgi:hypothetical protein
MLTALQPEFHNQLPNDWSMMQKHHPARNMAGRTRSGLAQACRFAGSTYFAKLASSFAIAAMRHCHGVSL